MKTFEELGIAKPFLKAIAELGFEQPMPVQEEVIPYLLGEDIDLIALAQTGTGKTAAFGLPLLQKIDLSGGRPQALVLCPTRELCLQIADDLNSYSKYLSDVHILPVYGGTPIDAQIRALRRGVQIVVATPGRLLDLMRREAVSLSDIHTVVLDEADEMLNMGFAEDLEQILADIPSERHLLLFSATMPKEISKIAASYMKDPKEIVIGNKNEGNANIKHLYYMVSARHKYLALKRIADYYPNIYGIVFCRTRKETQEIADQLIQDGYNADSLHGDLSQAQRDYVMQKFRVRNLQLLVATDVAARGLDVNDLTHVIHFGLPDDVESYTHRSGRTARAGKTGLSIAICHVKEKGKIKNIERTMQKQIERARIPSGAEICEKQLFNLADRIERVDIENTTAIDSVLNEVNKKLEWIEKDELIRRVMALEFNRMLDYYQRAEDVEEVVERKKDEASGDRKNRKRGTGEAEEGMTRLFINFGKMDQMFPNRLIELINRCIPGRVNIGRIDLMPRFAFFDVDEFEAKNVVETLNRYEVDGRRIHVEYADAKKDYAGGKKGGDKNFSARRKDFDGRRSENPTSRKNKGRKEKPTEGRFYDKFDSKQRKRRK
ncbi:DEAD/DEAH box helicase [Porphyromonas gingivalis]|uniref:DEAD/DEAH box helicase n=1 Tax=Porphyromonas gingivalis TaxID=837 RepID=UPI001B8D7B6A|nr:DEAD/DEAH box helicase [Porphyromonas gingivalis]